MKQSFIDKYFTDTVSRVGGIGIEEIAEDYAKMHAEAFDLLGYDSDMTLDSIGQHKSKARASSICIILRQSICCSSLHRQAIMNCSGNIRNWSMKRVPELICEDSLNLTSRRKACQSKK